MAGDAKANKANSGRRSVQLSESSQASVKDMDRVKTLTGQARKTAERVVRRKRKTRRALKASRG